MKKKNELINLLPKKFVQKKTASTVAEEKPVYNTNKNEPEKKETPLQQQQTFKKAVIASGGTSITGFLNKKNIQENKEEEKAKLGNLPKKDFTAEQLEKVWNDFGNLIKSKGKMNLASTLLIRKPLLKENLIIEFEIDNKAQEEEIENAKTDMMSYLREKLQNYSIQLQLTFTKNDTGKKLYTASDKFKHMSEKNPALLKLKQNFDLEIDI